MQGVGIGSIMRGYACSFIYICGLVGTAHRIRSPTPYQPPVRVIDLLVGL